MEVPAFVLCLLGIDRKVGKGLLHLSAIDICHPKIIGDGKFVLDAGEIKNEQRPQPGCQG